MSTKLQINEIVRVGDLTYVITEIKRIGMPLFAIVLIQGQTNAQIVRTFVSHEMAVTALMNIEREANDLFKGVI